jgi:RimJ/RimL family protein N-acetyltransferase
VSADGHPTLEDLEEWIGRDDPEPQLGLLAAVRKVDGDVIGYCGLIPNAHGQDDEPELAYEFLRAAWAREYATEAARAVLDWARESGYRRLWATVREWNTASRRVMTKLGFVESTRVERDSVHGDSLFYVKEL